MAKADLTKLKDKYSNFQMKPKKKDNGLKKSNKKISAKKRKYLTKCKDELFSEFTSSDWIMYFQDKYYQENDRGYSIVGQKMWAMEHAIYKSLMKDYTPRDIKLMIDFIFDSNQDIKPKLQAGSYLLSKGWLQSVYQNAKLWQTGDYKSDSDIRREKYEASKPKKRNREWTNTEEIEETKEDKKILPKRRKKGKITF